MVDLKIDVTKVGRLHISADFRPSNSVSIVDMAASIEKLNDQLSGLRSLWNEAKKSIKWIEDVRNKIKEYVDVKNPIGDLIREIDSRLQVGFQVDDFITG